LSIQGLQNSIDHFAYFNGKPFSLYNYLLFAVAEATSYFKLRLQFSVRTARNSKELAEFSCAQPCLSFCNVAWN